MDDRKYRVIKSWTLSWEIHDQEYLEKVLKASPRKKLINNVPKLFDRQERI